MSKAMGTILGLVVSLVLFSAMTMAQAGGNNAEKDKEHHSRLAKVAFWRHHTDADKNAKRAQATQASSKQSPATSKNVPKQEQHASDVSKPSTKKAPVANKTKARQTQDPKAASLKQ